MAELTAELIAGMPTLSDPQLSPDGRLVAYVVAPAGMTGEHPASALWIAPVDGSAPPRQFTAGAAEDCRPRWSPDGQHIAFLSDRAQRGTAQLYIIDCAGGEARPLTSERQSSSLPHQGAGSDPPATERQSSSLPNQRAAASDPPATEPQSSSLPHQRAAASEPPATERQSSSLPHQGAGASEPPAGAQHGEVNPDGVPDHAPVLYRRVGRSAVGPGGATLRPRFGALPKSAPSAASGSVGGSSDANKRPVLAFAWSPEGASIAFTSADEPDAEDERREKERDDAGVFGERWQYARLRLLTVASGAVRVLHAPARHISELAWSPRGDAIACISWQAPPLEFALYDNLFERVPLDGGVVQPLCAVSGHAASLLWTTDGESLLFLASAGNFAQSSQAVWSVPVQGGQPRRLALGEVSCARELLQSAGAPPQVEHALVPETGAIQPVGELPRVARAAVAIADGLNTVLAWLDPRTGAVEPFYHASQADGPADVAGWSVQSRADGVIAVGAVRGSGTHAWELWGGRFRVQGRYPELRQLSAHTAELDAVSFVSQQPFRWQAADGLALDGLLLRPPSAGAQALPLITLVHGGPYGRWTLGFNLSWGRWAQWLATAGYVVFLPNPRGGMGHGESFAAAARSDVGGADYRDVIAGIDAVLAQGIADPARLGIGGWSQGGFMSAWAVTQTRRFKAAVVGAGPTDWGMMTATSDMLAFQRELGGSAPWDGAGPHRSAQLSPISFASRVSTPVLILLGQNDERVPVNQAISFHRALRERGVRSELVVYPREPHAVRERAHQVDILHRVRAWYARWL